MSNTPKAVRVKTGRGTAVFPHTFQPVSWDEAKQRSVPDPDGGYDISVALSGSDATALKREIDAVAKRDLKSCKNYPYKPEFDKESGEETGRTIFKFKQYGKDRDGVLQRIPHFNVKGKPLGSDFRLNGGSTVIISGRISSYPKLGGGVRMLVDAIQVIVEAAYENNPFGDESDDIGSEDGAEASDTGFPDETGNDEAPDF